jgi:uncharacterized damage-inducible protein DinB
MEGVKWFDRKFDFTVNQNIFPSILERLRGTPARLEEKIDAINPGLLSRKPANGWSIKENVGHLSDLEPLWQLRLEDIISGREELTATDLQNTKTSQAGHNERDMRELLLEFRSIRSVTINQLEEIDETTVFKSAYHPRLKIPMRTMDLFLFVADHDDHHLARITALARG